MSRIGKMTINVPENVGAHREGDVYVVTGEKGQLRQLLPSGVTVEQSGRTIVVSRQSDEATHRSAHGLARTLIDNMIQGVSVGFTKQLELHGVGYRAVVNGTDLVMTLGFSHPIIVQAPEHIVFQVEKNVISVTGIDKALVGEIAAKIRSYRKPEPYKGKGIRYIGETVRRKVGKAAKA